MSKRLVWIDPDKPIPQEWERRMAAGLPESFSSLFSTVCSAQANRLKIQQQVGALKKRQEALWHAAKNAALAYEKHRKKILDERIAKLGLVRCFRCRKLVRKTHKIWHDTAAGPQTAWRGPKFEHYRQIEEQCKTCADESLRGTCSFKARETQDEFQALIKGEWVSLGKKEENISYVTGDSYPWPQDRLKDAEKWPDLPPILEFDS